MKTKNLLVLLAIASIMIFASCKKDDSVPTLTKEEATAALNAINTNYADISRAFNTTDAVLIQDEIMEIGFPEDWDAPLKSPSSSKDFKAKYSKAFKSGLAKSFGDDSPLMDFDFESKVGTYTYNGSWSHTPTPTDKIILKFPYKSGTATLTYSEYQTMEYNSEPYLSHLKFKAEISGLSTPVYTWVYTASLSDKGTIVSINHTFGEYSRYESVSMTKTIGVTSYTLKLSFDFSFKKNSDIILAETANITMVMRNKASSVKMDIKVTIMNIVIKYNIDADENTDIEDDNPGNFMTISVWTTDGVKVADVIFKGPNYEPYFKYSDGTEEKVSEKLGNEYEEGSLTYRLANTMQELMYLMMMLGGMK